MIVVNLESKYWVEVLDASKMFDLHRSKPNAFKSSFEHRKNKKNEDQISRQLKIYSIVDHSNIMEHGQTRIILSRSGVSRKRKASGSKF